MTFWLNVLVALIGALLTVIIAYVTYLLNLHRNERRALTSLVSELHHRRAFSGGAVLNSNARELADYARANASVLSIKDEIRRTRDSVRVIPALQGPLSLMTRACNTYLERAESDPDSYAIGLIELRAELHSEIRKLAEYRRGVPTLVPGCGA